MHSNELTPAQVAMLDYFSPIEADSLFQYLSTTLSISIIGYKAHDDKDDPLFRATEKALEAWYFTLEIMDKLHALAVEERKKNTQN